MDSSNPEQDSLSPHSTVTTETGDQLLYRVKQADSISAALKHQTSWTSSGRPDVANTINSSHREKCSIKQIAIFPPRVKRRVVYKNGNINVSKERVEKRHQRYLQDTFTTMVDIQWRWNLLVFALAFILSWLAFAVIWWVICLAHGDFDEHPNVEWVPCVSSLDSFTAAFLFSIETQHTIGYGGRATNTECPEAIFVMCLQSITGVVIQCFVVGFVFAKLSRPQKRSQTLLFSNNAVISLRDGKLCLMFRIGDVRNRSHIIGASVTAIVINRKCTSEGETIPFYQYEIPVKFDGSLNSLFLIWPATVVHIIDEESPFYNLNADTLMREKFEIVVILEGTVESTGQSIQARSSYLPSEILWGRRFEQLVAYKKDTGEHRVDYSRFNGTFEVETPSCSARELHDIQTKLTNVYTPRNNIHFKLPQSSSNQSSSPLSSLVAHNVTPPLVPYLMGNNNNNSQQLQQQQHQQMHHHGNACVDYTATLSTQQSVPLASQVSYNHSMTATGVTISSNRTASHNTLNSSMPIVFSPVYTGPHVVDTLTSYHSNCTSSDHHSSTTGSDSPATSGPSFQGPL